ncbi:uncharacterized protein JCM15063_005431 [Sporobolomyces koalae]|uniref:uncharacterized protein n=1 Tax=Sporobolomyces koalae TaxID=500713 RepID=UPI00317B03C7
MNGDTPGPSLVPRAVKRRPIAAGTKPALSTRPLVSAPTTTTTSPVIPSVRPSREIQTLEQLLTVIESSFSDHGLTSHRSSTLLDKLQQGSHEWIHLSQVLNLPPVRALTSKLVDLKDAVSLRPSRIIKVDETGYQIGRQDPIPPSLEHFDLADWHDLSIYLENIPFNTSLNSIAPDDPSTFSLVSFLSEALSTPIQKLVLPALYDPQNPPALDEDSSDPDSQHDHNDSQAAAFQASLRAQQGLDGSNNGGKKHVKGLPKGGGKFKGFAFIVLQNRDEVERILEDWSRVDSQGDLRKDQSQVEKSDQGKESMCRDRAKKAGMHAMTYSRWLERKKEYLAYRRSLAILLEAQSDGRLDELRNPPQPKDHPPHLRQPASSTVGPELTETHSTPAVTRRHKRQSSPVTDSAQSKRHKRASSPSATPTTRHTRKLRTPSPLPTGPEPLDLSSDVALSIQGAYPQGCVLWVRNVHEKSSKTSLKTLFGKLLDQLQEGSGKGVEFVDYEKGLDTCYVRYSSGPLASLTCSHFASTPTYHLTQPDFSPVSSLTSEALSKAQNEEHRRPLMVELLQGERERQYWASLPESTRKSARMSAGGVVGLVKEPRGYNKGTTRLNAEPGQGGAVDGQHQTVNEVGTATAGMDSSRKRKKPSRM